MSKQAPFYDPIEQELIHGFSQLPSSTFRMWEPCLSVPFWEMNLWGGYVTEAQEYGSRLQLRGEESVARWKKAMQHSLWGFDSPKHKEFGNDLRVRLSGPMGPFITSPWNLKCSHHYSVYERLTGNDISTFDRIVEWGGGSGDFAKFVFNMGFSGEYVIADLPGTSLVSKANISEDPSLYNVSWTTTPPPTSDKKTLFVSTWALSETPMDLRVEVMETVSPDNWLIIYQRHIWDYDNERFFSCWEGEREEIPWIKWDRGSELIAW